MGSGSTRPAKQLKSETLRHYSLKSLKIEMERRGLRNHFESTLSLRGVEKTLANPFYHGQILIVRTGEAFDGIHEPIIDQATYKRVQAIIAMRCGPKVSKHRHAFVGLFRCAGCVRHLSQSDSVGTSIIAVTSMSVQ